MNLRTRYISTLIIVAGLSLAILTVTSVDRLGKVVQSETQQQMADTLSLYQTSLDRTITSAISNISLLSNNHLVDQYLELEGSERYSLLYGVISKSIAQMQALYQVCRDQFNFARRIRGCSSRAWVKKSQRAGSDRVA